MKQRYLWINSERIAVSEEVYHAYRRSIDRERARAQRYHKCGQADFRQCHGDCGHCPWVREGTDMLSFQEAFCATQSDEPSEQPLNVEDTSTSLVEDIIVDRQLMNDLFRKMDQLVPDGGQIVQMLMDECSEREIARALGVNSQSTINYRARKIKKYLREHWKDFFRE